jgi:hypothetical protein
MRGRIAELYICRATIREQNSETRVLTS